MVSESQLRRYVALMAARLDKLLPNPDWRMKVSLKTLNMTDSDNCVLGQIFGSHAIGLGRLRLTGEEPVVAAFVEPSARPMWEREIRKAQQV